MINLKRFGTIYLKDMTKEIEDTIISDETQMRRLYEKIEELERIIKQKDIENKILKEENEAYKIQIETFKKLFNDKNKENDNREESDKLLNFDKYKKYINNKDNIEKINEEYKKNNGPQLLDFNKMKKVLNNEIDENISIQSSDDNLEKIKSDKIIKELNIKENLSNESKNIDDVNIFSNNICPNIDTNKNDEKENTSDSHLGENNVKKFNKKDNKNIPILERFPINVYETIDLKFTEKIQNNKEIKELFDLIRYENNYKIKYQYEIAVLHNKYENDITIDDIIEFKIKNEGLKSSEKTRLKRKIERCKYLYEKYQNNLSRVGFQLYHIGYMNKKEWKLWIEELEKIMDKMEPIPCQYIWKKGDKKGSECGMINCKNHCFLS